MIEKAQLEAWIAELGTTLDEISAVLRAAEIKGIRGSAANCPIAMWLIRKAGTDVTVTVGFVVGVGASTVNVYADDNTGSHVQAELSEAVRMWIRAFDNAQLPEFDNMHVTEA